MTHIVEFLEARIAEDEAIARAAQPEDWWWEEKYSNMEDPLAAYPIHHNPARALTECAAKRAIVRYWNICTNEEILYHLAAVYAAHPDYRQEWKPPAADVG